MVVLIYEPYSEEKEWISVISLCLKIILTLVIILLERNGLFFASNSAQSAEEKAEHTKPLQSIPTPVKI